MDTEIPETFSAPFDKEPSAPIKRETESVDDFEHLEAENNSLPKDSGDKASPLTVGPENPVLATKEFLAEITGGYQPENFAFDKPLPDEPKASDTLAFLKAEVKEPSPRLTPEDREPSPVEESPPPVPKHRNLEDSPLHSSEERFSPSPEPEFHSIKPSTPTPPPPVVEEKIPEPVKEEPKKIEEPPKPKFEEPPPKPVIEEPKKPKVEEPVETPFVKEEKKRTPVVKPTEELPDIGANDLFVKYGLDAWFNPERLHPKVESLVYWREPKKSGAVFGVLMVTLLSLTYFSLISVVAYLCLATLILAIAFRIYKNVMQAVQKTSDGHPFKEWLEVDVTVPEDKVREMSVVAVARINRWVIELRRLFLVEDLVDSIKFAIALWALTNVGAWFNGLTLVIIGVVAMFTLPKVYENNKAQVDAYVSLATAKISEITNKVKAAVPMGKKDSDKPKDQ